MPASQRALLIVCPALRTSSQARFSLSASTASAKRRSSRARSPGATDRQAGQTARARAIAADLDYRITVLADGCLDADPEVHRVLTEKVFPRQAEVSTVADWIASPG